MNKERTFRTSIYLSCLLIFLATWFANSQYSGEMLNHSGIVAAGNLVTFYQPDRATVLTGFTWGTITVGQMGSKYAWMKTSANGTRVSYHSNNNPLLRMELFWEITGNRWGEWTNDTTMYFMNQWVHLLIRLTPEVGVPSGPFSFNSTFIGF